MFHWNEEWERRKSYLVRSLFEDVSKLSPISETSNADILSTERPYSPLPDLIIEKEKNRHDESNEFYRELEIKMIKLYKKLFHGLGDTSSEETVKLIESFSSYKDYILEQKMLDVEISQFNSDTNNTSKYSDTSEINEAFELAYHNLTDSQESNGTTETERSPSITHEIIVTQAIVHAEPANNDREDLNNNVIAHRRISRSISIERSITRDLKHKQIDYMSCNQDTQRRRTDYDRLVATQANIDKGINIETVQSDNYELDIEVMRLATRKTKSFGSILEESTASRGKESWSPIAVVKRRMSMIQDVKSSPETEIESNSSVENSLNQAFYTYNSTSSSRKRTRLGSTSENAPNKKRRYETISVQTDPTTRTNWDLVRENFFVGTPLIYNLCYCRNHTCD